jgi:hypothetical protein
MMADWLVVFMAHRPSECTDPQREWPLPSKCDTGADVPGGGAA